MIKCVLFDLDGVLVDACEWHYESLNRALKKVAGIEINREDHESTYNGLPTKAKLDLLLKSGLIVESQMREIWDLKQQYTIEVISEKAAPDASKVVLHNFLKSRDLKVGCVTNSIRKTAELMLRQTGQIDLLDFLITNEDVSRPKPDPAGYQKAMDFFGVGPDKTLIFEDSEKGLKAAIDSGAFTVQVQNAAEVLSPLVLGIIDQLEEKA